MKHKLKIGFTFIWAIQMILTAFLYFNPGHVLASEIAIGPDYMPPHPHVLEEKKKVEKQLILPELAEQRIFSANKINKAQILTESPVRPAAKALVVMIEFPDQPGTIPTRNFGNMLFGTEKGTVRHFYQVNSLQTFDLQGQVVDGSTLSAQTRYIRVALNKRNYADDPRDAIKEALEKLDLAGFDFSPYQTADNEVPYLFVVHSGQGQEFSGDQSDIWSHRWILNDNNSYYTVKSGVKFKDYMIMPEYFGEKQSTIGVFAHEFGHMLGLPDLYDTEYTSQGSGDWSLMAGGAWLGPSNDGSSPAMLDAWSRSFLGWVNVETVDSNRKITMDYVEDDSKATIYQIPLNSNEYLLLENRQKESYDQYLPGTGLLVWKVDHTIMNPDSIQWKNNIVNCAICGNHYGLLLLEADGQFNLTKMGNDTGSQGDPFPGMKNNRWITGATNPSTDTFAGEDTSIEIRSISNSGLAMSAIVMTGDSETSVLDHLSLSPDKNFSLKVGENKNLTVRAFYTDGTDSDVTTKAEWSSSNQNVVSVDAGKVKAVGAGKAAITASYEGQVASIEVTVSEKKVTKLVANIGKLLNVKSLSMKPGNTQQIELMATYEDKSTQNVTQIAGWNSSNEKVASVTEGLITGEDFGKSTITADYGSKKVSITVQIYLKSLSATMDNKPVTKSLSMKPGDTQAIGLKADYGDGKKVEVLAEKAVWKSLDSDVASVDEMGLITANGKPGKTIITAEYGGKKVSITVEIKLKSLIASTDQVTNVKTLKMKPEDSVQVVLYADYGDGRIVEVQDRAAWKVKDKKIASVNDTGLITAHGFGTTTITAEYGDKKMSITVDIKLKSLAAKTEAGSPVKSLVMIARDTEQIMLIATYGDDENTTLDVTNKAEWKSDKTKIAQIDANGQITAKAKGKAAISGKYGGKTVSFGVTVK